MKIYKQNAMYASDVYVFMVDLLLFVCIDNFLVYLLKIVHIDLTIKYPCVFCFPVDQLIFTLSPKYGK